MAEVMTLGMVKTPEILDNPQPSPRTYFSALKQKCKMDAVHRLNGGG